MKKTKSELLEDLYQIREELRELKERYQTLPVQDESFDDWVTRISK